MVVEPVEPIRPERLIQPKQALQIPGVVIIAVNKLINENWDGHQAKVWQGDILVQLSRLTGIDKETVLRNGWLNIEPLYRNVGYEVNYVAPPMGTKGDAYFEFQADVSKFK